MDKLNLPPDFWLQPRQGAGSGSHSYQLSLLKSAIEFHSALVRDTVEYFGEEAQSADLRSSIARVHAIVFAVAGTIERLAAGTEDSPEAELDQAVADLLTELRRLSGHEIVVCMSAEPGALPYLKLGSAISRQ